MLLLLALVWRRRRGLNNCLTLNQKRGHLMFSFSTGDMCSGDINVISGSGIRGRLLLLLLLLYHILLFVHKSGRVLIIEWAQLFSFCVLISYPIDALLQPPAESALFVGESFRLELVAQLGPRLRKIRSRAESLRFAPELILKADKFFARFDAIQQLHANFVEKTQLFSLVQNLFGQPIELGLWNSVVGCWLLAEVETARRRLIFRARWFSFFGVAVIAMLFVALVMMLALTV